MLRLARPVYDLDEKSLRDPYRKKFKKSFPLLFEQRPKRFHPGFTWKTAYNAALALAEENRKKAQLIELHEKQEKEEQILQGLILLEANPEAQKEYKEYRKNAALLLAARAGYSTIARYLLNHQVSPNLMTVDRSTPLILATYSNRFEIVRILLEHGADFNCQTGVSSNLISIARSLGHSKIEHLLLFFAAHQKIASEEKRPLKEQVLHILKIDLTPSEKTSHGLTFFTHTSAMPALISELEKMHNPTPGAINDAMLKHQQGLPQDRFNFIQRYLLQPALLKEQQALEESFEASLSALIGF